MAGGNTYQNKLSILATFWMNERDDDELKEFIEYNDLGLPLAYLLLHEIVLPTEQSESFINETYDSFIASLSIEDGPWESLDEMLGDQG